MGHIYAKSPPNQEPESPEPKPSTQPNNASELPPARGRNESTRTKHPNKKKNTKNPHAEEDWAGGFSPFSAAAAAGGGGFGALEARGIGLGESGAAQSQGARGESPNLFIFSPPPPRRFFFLFGEEERGEAFRVDGEGGEEGVRGEEERREEKRRGGGLYRLRA